MSTKATQANREVMVTSKLAKDALLFRAMQGCEEMGRLFEFRLELLSENPGIQPGMLLGTDMSTKLKLADGGMREFNGVVSQFSVLESWPGDKLTCYEAIVRPRLWLLTRSSHCRFFYKKTVREIIKELLAEGDVFYEDKCTANYPPLDNCVQYCETDFDFFSRLLEREGIYYYFVHQDSADKLVIGDSINEYAPTPNYGSIPFATHRMDDQPPTECIFQWKSHAVVATDMSQLNAFDYKNARDSNDQGLIARATVQGSEPTYATHEYAAYYTTEADGHRYAQARIDAHRAQTTYSTGKASARGIFPGGVFKLTAHPREDQNGDYLVTQAAYEVESDYYMPVPKAGQPVRPVFDCSFIAIPRNNTYRPQQLTPRPRVGLQTARVVASGNDGIEAGEYGEVKVQFHWERFNRTVPSEQSQRCWVRVAQTWAGERWGTVFLPRVGQEVVVAFLDDDIDHPVIVGSVYNSTNNLPYTMPANGAVSTIRTASVGAGPSDRNELRFNDKHLQMLMYTGGRLDSYVKKSAYTWIGEDKHLIVQGKQLVKVGSQNVTVAGDQSVKVDGSVSIKANGTLSHKAGNIAHQAELDYAVKSETMSLHAKEVVIEAGLMLTLKVGPTSFITLSPAGVQISGPIVGLNSGGSPSSIQGPPEQPIEHEQPERADDGSSVK